MLRTTPWNKTKQKKTQTKQTKTNDTLWPFEGQKAMMAWPKHNYIIIIMNTEKLISLLEMLEFLYAYYTCFKHTLLPTHSTHIIVHTTKTHRQKCRATSSHNLATAIP